MWRLVNGSGAFFIQSHSSLSSVWVSKMFSSGSASDFDEDLSFLFLMQLVQKERRKRRFWVHPVNRLRSSKGEFHCLVKELEGDEERFQLYFRVTQTQFADIHSMIEKDIKKEHTKFRRPIGTKERLAVCLRFLATGNSFRSLAFNYRIGFTTVRNIVKEAGNAIWKNMAPIVMPTPSEDMWKDIAKDFDHSWQFSNCIGALDGKHINLICPINAGSTFFNYKQEHSIVLLALVDALYKFIMVDVGAYGRNSDGGIYEKSVLGRLLDRNELNVPENKPLYENSEPMLYVIVADAAFPLKTYIMKPYSKAKLVNNDQNKIFNYRLSRLSRTVENAFGILRVRFRVFQGPLQVQPNMADEFVLAACCLHNYLGTQTPELEIYSSENNGSTSYGLLNIDLTRRNPPQNAVGVREKFKEYFIAEDQLPWQMENIRRGRL